VIKDVDPEEFSAANVPDPATERLLAGRSEVDEGQSMGKSEKEAPESKIRRFSEGMERFETRPDPEDSLKYTPEEKEKLAGVKGEVPPWWPKEPEKESYFYGAVQAIKKTGCSADDVHIAVERDYTGKDLTTEQKAILKAGWPGMEPYYMKREKYPEPARKEPYPTPYPKPEIDAESPYPYRYPAPTRGTRYPYPEPETGRMGAGRFRRFSEGMERFERARAEEEVRVINFADEFAGIKHQKRSFTPKEKAKLAEQRFSMEEIHEVEKLRMSEPKAGYKRHTDPKDFPEGGDANVVIRTFGFVDIGPRGFMHGAFSRYAEDWAKAETLKPFSEEMEVVG